MDLQDRQLPIVREILNRLIAATPEEWTKIDYLVDVSWEEGYVSLTADISSPEGHDAAYASVSDELYAATERLIDLMKEHEQRVKHMHGHAWLDEKGRWMYNAKFAYADRG